MGGPLAIPILRISKHGSELSTMIPVPGPFMYSEKEIANYHEANQIHAISEKYAQIN